MAERFAARLPAPHPGRRRLDRRGLSRRGLSRRDQHPPRARRVERGVCRAGRQGRGQPRLAQDEGRLGRLECAFARRRADRAADPRRHSRACPARQKGDLDLVARGAWRARRRQKMLLAIKSMGGEGEAVWRALLDDLVRRGLRTPALVVIDGAPGLEKAVAALWPDMAVQRCTVHKHRNLLAHAPERLHEEISNDYRDMIYAATRRAARSRPGARRSSANGASNAAPSPTAWRKPATGCSHSPGSRRANGNRSEPRTRSSDCTRSSSARSTLRPCRPAPKPPPGCSGRCSPQDRSPCARSTDGRPSPRNQTINH